MVSDCSTAIEGSDAMQYDIGSITVPASCSEFTITLNHTGQLPAAAMGHNVVITRPATAKRHPHPHAAVQGDAGAGGGAWATP